MPTKTERTCRCGRTMWSTKVRTTKEGRERINGVTRREGVDYRDAPHFECYSLIILNLKKMFCCLRIRKWNIFFFLSQFTCYFYNKKLSDYYMYTFFDGWICGILSNWWWDFFSFFLVSLFPSAPRRQLNFIKKLEEETFYRSLN